MNLTGTRVLIIGAGGMLATDAVDELTKAGAVVTEATKDDVDIVDAAGVAAAVAQADVVFNCAAYTAVDAAETDEDTAYVVNADGPRVLAEACAAAGVRLVHISTDYVFAGDATEPYPEDAPMAPQGAYGRTKAAGEEFVNASGADALIVRTAWLYGAAGPCFPKTMVQYGRSNGALQVVDDQTGQPTWTRDLARFVIRLLEADAPAGTYHGTSAGQGTWCDFARDIVASAGLGDIVTPTTSDAYPRPAPRPAWSVLGHAAATAIGVASIGDWRERWEAASAEILSA